MNYDYDIAVIGAGLLGCFAARNLARYNWKIAVFEKNSDVCTEVSRANTAIIYPGYDLIPGSLKARLCAFASRDFERLCNELGVRYKKDGSLMVAFGERGNSILRKKYEQGIENGVPGLALLSADEVMSLEPNISKSSTGALFSPLAGTVNPWELCIAAAENAVANGVQIALHSKIDKISKTDGGFILYSNGKLNTARAVLNCAGLFADDICALLTPPDFKLSFTYADYVVLDTTMSDYVNHIIMCEFEDKIRGANVIPTVDGNILLGPSKTPCGDKSVFLSSKEGINSVLAATKNVFPEMPLDGVVRSFASVRPSVVMQKSDESVHDLFIREAPGFPCFINLAGIKTPGLTCANEIGKYLCEMLIERLGHPGENVSFCPERPAPVRFDALSYNEKKMRLEEDRAFGNIVCRCRKITEAEIRNAIERGATTVDGVKRRTGALTGRCQGGFCTQRIIEILAEELNASITEIRKDEAGSELIIGGDK